MQFSPRMMLIIASLMVLLSLAGLAVLSLGARLRAQVVALKLQGSLYEMSWSDVWRAVQPGTPYSLQTLIATKNPYHAVRNPFHRQADIAAGAEMFRSQCASCHGPDGTGGVGPDLTRQAFRHGGTDLALFRTIARGVPGTAMPGCDLPEAALWRVVAFVRSLARDSDPESLTQRAAKGLALVEAPRVTYERLLHAADEPHNWLTYSGTYMSHRYSRLDQIHRDNLKGLRLKWTFQLPTTEQRVETTPLVVDNVMYLTEPPNNVLALDAHTGQLVWSYERTLPDRISVSVGRDNRGLAVLEDKLYMGTLDAHLVALDARTGTVMWDVEVADYRAGYSITGAPLAVKDKIIMGIAGGDFNLRAFLDAYQAGTGERLWRFFTIPGPGEPGHETWAGDSWKTGGGSTWLPGSFDPELNLIYWGVGNPAPAFRGDERQGDNLYSNSMVALDVDTGRLKWYFQSTPHDEHDWDAVQIPVLVDAEFMGRPRKLLLWANRNAFFYILDRQTGQFLLAREFAKQTWAEGIDANGRPILSANAHPTPQGTLIYPGGGGGTNWWSPSYHPVSGLFYVPAREYGSFYFKHPTPYRPGSRSGGGNYQVAGGPNLRMIRALSPQTGTVEWEYRLPERPKSKRPLTGMGGLLSTAGGVVFGGSGKRFFALDAYSGSELWHLNLGGEIVAAPITYLSGGRQRVTIAAGRAIFTFGLDDD
jgi:alcohol dehydrogenase (cytochrome c)